MKMKKLIVVLIIFNGIMFFVSSSLYFTVYQENQEVKSSLTGNAGFHFISFVLLILIYKLRNQMEKSDLFTDKDE